MYEWHTWHTMVRVTYKLPAVRCPMAFVHLPHVHVCEEKNQCNKTEKSQDILLRVLLANSELFRDWMWYQNQVTSTEKRTIWVNRIIPMERRNQKAARSWKHHKQPALVMIPTPGASKYCTYITNSYQLADLARIFALTFDAGLSVAGFQTALPVSAFLVDTAAHFLDANAVGADLAIDALGIVSTSRATFSFNILLGRLAIPAALKARDANASGTRLRHGYPQRTEPEQRNLGRNF